MTDATKARLKIAYGVFKGVNAVASACGFGVVSCVTGNHHTSKLGMAIARANAEKAQRLIKEGEAELAAAKQRNS